jgi:hypothetical protein
LPQREHLRPPYRRPPPRLNPRASLIPFLLVSKTSEHILPAPLKNAGVSAIAFGAMDAASAGLSELASNAAVPAARGLMANMGIGAASGFAGGVAHSEADAVIKQGRALPTAQNFLTNVAGYTALGGTMGVAGTLLARAINPPETFGDGSNRITVYSDSSGTPVRAVRTQVTIVPTQPL